MLIVKKEILLSIWQTQQYNNDCKDTIQLFNSVQIYFFIFGSNSNYVSIMND